MSNINAKPFSAAQRIIKAVFRGAPAIITSPDLNRQIDMSEEAFSQLQEAGFINATGGAIQFVVAGWDDVNKLVNVGTDTTLSFTSISMGALELYFKGCQFSFAGVSFGAKVAQFTDKFYVSVFAVKTLITSEADTSDHLISGAKFADGTVIAAASHWVYTDAELVLSVNGPGNNAPAGKEFVCTVGALEFMPSVTGVTTKYSITSTSFIAGKSSKQSAIPEAIMSFPVGRNPYTVAPTGTDYVKEFLNPADTLRKAFWKLVRDSIKQDLRNAAFTTEIAAVRAGLNTVPQGIISMWSGAIVQIPIGYALCNGNGGLPINGLAIPDLSGMFIAGYKAADSDYNTIGPSLIGVKQVKLTEAQTPLPVHAHKYDANPEGANNSTIVKTDGYSSNGSPFEGTVKSSSDTRVIEHHENRPPYYVLAYIIKT